MTEEFFEEDMVEEEVTNISTEKKEEEESVYDFVKAILFAAFIALAIRSFAIEPFNIPSGSMFPTLLVGDYLFVEKYSYGYSRYSFPMGIFNFDGRIFEKSPERGDVAVFRHPRKPGIDYIKRIIGLPGDSVQVIDGILNINGEAVKRDYRESLTVDVSGKDIMYKKYIETLPNGIQHFIYERSDNDFFDNTPKYEIPEGYLFVMGDNRDSSLDSRAEAQVGFIPTENLIGRAWFLFFSTEGIKNKCDRAGKFATARKVACTVTSWPMALRYSRFFKNIKDMHNG